MIGVVVVPGPSSKMHGLDASRSLALLPIGDRPLIQHIVESLVANQIIVIEIIVGHAPEEVEALLGSGDRWGCKFRYHLQTQPLFPYRSLRVIPEVLERPWLLVHAEQYPSFSLPEGSIDQPILYYGGATESTRSKNHPPFWRGTGLFPRGNLALDIANDTPEQLQERLRIMASTGQARAVHIPEWLDASTPTALLNSQALLLSQQLGDFMISGTERQNGVWISRNVVLHPTVELRGPLYIGPNSRLNRNVCIGPNTVIGSECIVDSQTLIENALVTSGSYVGEGLELKRAIVNHNLLINVSLETSINVTESFLLGSLREHPKQHWLASFGESSLALALLIFLSPITFLSFFYYTCWRRMSVTTIECVKLPAQNSQHDRITYRLPCIGRAASILPLKPNWTSFLTQFVPGLTAVLRAQLHFVGMPPRAPEQVDRLSPEWQELYLQNKAGLISEASLTDTEQDETQLYIADAFYAAHSGRLYDWRLALQYFSRLIASTF
jgi:NDP-sugar pyrophosphorylase family protein